MKKFNLFILMLGFFLLTGCGGTKDVATLEQFSTVAEENSFYVIDTSNNYSVDYILNARKATTDTIEMEMIEYSDSDYAKKVQESHFESFNLLKNTGAFEEKDKGSNYYRYTLVSNGYYMVSTRIDNTLIFCKTVLSNKELVEKVLDELNY